jgi:hypothetical protein
MNTEKNEFRVGDFVKVYKFDCDMPYTFVKGMTQYIGKVARIYDIINGGAIRLEFLDKRTGKFNPAMWSWHSSVLRHLTKVEKRRYFWAII